MITGMIAKVGRFARLSSGMANSLFTFVLAIIGLSAFAQSKDTLRPDANFYRAMQSVYPDFAPSEDSTALDASIFKYYSITNYLASQADSLGIDEDPTIKQQMEYAKKLLEARILADAYNAKGYPKLNYTEQDLKKVYEENKWHFQKGGYANYIIGQAFDTTKATVKQVLNILEDYKKKKVASESDVPKISRDNEYYVAYAQQIPFDPQQPFYPLYKDAKAGEIKGPLVRGSSKVFILATYIEAPIIPPFEEVRKDCEEILRAKLISEYQKELEEKARKNFPIAIEKKKATPASGK